MNPTKGNEHYMHVLDNLLDYRQTHEHVYFKEKKPVF